MTATTTTTTTNSTATDDPRAMCWRCRRPQSTCWCAELPTLRPKTRVVIVQHPREADTAIGTARMVHLSLQGSELKETLQIDDAFDLDGAALLFPADDARPLESWVEAPPRTLVVVDGTWSQAKKLLTLNPRLAALPRMSFTPEKPGNYRIRKEPTDMHLSTIEAVAHVLGVLEGDVDGYAALLRPFTVMVDRQIAAEAAHAGDHESRRRRARNRPVQAPMHELLTLDRARAVVIYAEANLDPRHARTTGAPEIIHLIASKPWAAASSSELFFEARIQPRRVMHDDVPSRLSMTRADFAESIDDAVARFRAFYDDGPWVSWGAFARDQLKNEGLPARGFVDVRALAARTLGHPAGGIGRAAADLGLDASGVDDERVPRGLRMQATVDAIARELVRRAPPEVG